MRKDSGRGGRCRVRGGTRGGMIGRGVVTFLLGPVGSGNFVFGFVDGGAPLVELEALFVGGEAMERDEFVDGDFGAERVVEGLFRNDVKGGFVEGSGLAIEKGIDGCGFEFVVFVAEVFGEFAILVVAAEFVIADFDAEVFLEFLVDDAVREFGEPVVNLVDLFRGEFFELGWEFVFHNGVLFVVSGGFWVQNRDRKNVESLERRARKALRIADCGLRI